MTLYDKLKKNITEVQEPLSQGEKNFKALHNPDYANLVPGVTDQEHLFKGVPQRKDPKTASYEGDESEKAYDRTLKVKEEKVIKGGYRDDDGKYHQPKTSSNLLKDRIANKIAIAKKTADAMRKEEVEALDELSPQTLGSYAHKATKDASANLKKIAGAKDRYTGRQFQGRANKRETGADMAIDKIRGNYNVKVHAKEEVEESTNLYSIQHMSSAKLKFHAINNMPHGSYSNKQIKAEHDRRMRTEPAYVKTKASLANTMPVKEELKPTDHKAERLDLINRAAAAGLTVAQRKAMRAAADLHGKAMNDMRYADAARKATKALGEEVEQIDELSPNLLHAYTKKAASQLANKATNDNATSNPRVQRKIKNRLRGIIGASGRNADRANDANEFSEEIELDEAGMPSSVIKSKQKYSNMSDKDFAAMHGNKPETELRSMAQRHGYGKDSSEYVNKVKRGSSMKKEEMESDYEETKKKTMKAFPNVKHFTKSGHPDWKKHGITNIPTTESVEIDEEADLTKIDTKTLQSMVQLHKHMGQKNPASKTAADRGEAELKSRMKKEDVDELDEVITKKTSMGDVISDFVHSKNPKFAGKSKKERMKQAMGAYYAMQRNEAYDAESSAEDDFEGLMAKTELSAIRDKASKLISMISDSDDLEAWVQSKISYAKVQLDGVYDYMTYSGEHKTPEESEYSQSGQMASNYGNFMNRMGEEYVVEKKSDDNEDDDEMERAASKNIINQMRKVPVDSMHKLTFENGKKHLVHHNNVVKALQVHANTPIAKGAKENVQNALGRSHEDFMHVVKYGKPAPVKARSKVSLAGMKEEADLETRESGMRPKKAIVVTGSDGKPKVRYFTPARKQIDVSSEGLKGNQHKIDANKNGKIDGQDFKLLRKKKVQEAEEMTPENVAKAAATQTQFGAVGNRNMQQDSIDKMQSDPLASKQKIKLPPTQGNKPIGGDTQTHPDIAEEILLNKLYDSLSEQNKEKFEAMLDTDDGIENLLDFAREQEL